MDLVYAGNGLTNSDSDDVGANYVADNVAFLTMLATSHAVPTAYHDKRAISPALRDQLIKQLSTEPAGSSLVVAPTVD